MHITNKIYKDASNEVDDLWDDIAGELLQRDLTTSGDQVSWDVTAYKTSLFFSSSEVLVLFFRVKGSGPFIHTRRIYTALVALTASLEPNNTIF